MVTKTLYINGSSGNAIIVNSNSNAESISSYSITSSYPYTSETYFHSAFPYLQLKGKVISASVTFPQVNPEYITWDTGGCDCFSANTLISMADGAHKKICDIQIGEQVLGINGSINKVTFIEKVPDSSWGYLYTPNPKFKPFITINHPIYINNQLTAVDPESVQNMYPWLGPIKQLKDFDIVPATGDLVYNLWLTGDGTYTANGYNTHSIMHTGDFLSLAFKHGWLTQLQVSNILIYFTNKGNHIQYGAYLINKALVYIKPQVLLKPIALSLIKETGLARLAIVKIGKLLGKLLHPNKGIK